jgi:hypothetical protein
MLERTRSEKAYREVAKLVNAYAKDYPTEQNVRLAELLNWLACTSSRERTEWLAEIGRKVGISNLEAQFANACIRTLTSFDEPMPDEGQHPHFSSDPEKSRHAQ